MTARYIVTRLAQGFLVLFLLSFIIFSLLYLAPGDLVKTLVGTRKATPEVIAAITEKYYLDQPFLVQYWNWLSQVFTGNFGESIRSGIPVTSVVGERLPLTFALTALAFVLALAVGIPSGFWAAHRQGSFTDRSIVAWSVIGVSAPSFALALVLLYAFSVMLRWFPTYGVGTGFWDQLWHLALPAIALAAGIAAIIIKVTRASVIGELNQDYVRFAKSRGLSRRRILGLYGKNAAIPIVTSTGLILATLFGATVLVEATFALPGIGQLLADAITFKDVPVVQAITLIAAALIVVSMLVVDILVVILNPAGRREKTLAVAA